MKAQGALVVPGAAFGTTAVNDNLTQTCLKCHTVGSEIGISQDFKWSKTGWVANGPDLEHVLKSRSPTI